MFPIAAHQTFQKLGVERWTLHLDERHIGDVAKVA